MNKSKFEKPKKCSTNELVSIGLFYFCFVSFLYNGVCYRWFFFNRTLGPYQLGTLILTYIFKCSEVFLPKDVFLRKESK